MDTVSDNEAETRNAALSEEQRPNEDITEKIKYPLVDRLKLRYVNNCIKLRTMILGFVKRALLLFIGYFICYFNISILLPIIGICTIVWYESSKSKVVKRIRTKVWASSMTRNQVHEVVKDLPSWITFPDKERAEWLNEIIAQLWPSLNGFIMKYMKGKVQTNIRKKFDSFRFEDMDFGDMPPKIDGVKVYNKFVSKQAIIVDFEVFYDSECDINFSMSGTQIGRIKDFQMGVELRVVFKPILLKPPIIGGIQIFCLNIPDINFELEGISGIPGFSYIIRQKIEEIIYKKVVFPNSVTKRFTKSIEASELKSIEPEGVLRVHVFEAKDLEKMDVTGKSDPYVILNVGAQEFRTPVIKKNLTPKWDCYCEFIILDPMAQQLYFKLYDQDEFSEDDFLGSGAVEISKVIKEESNNRWFTLEHVKHGQLHLRFSWLGLSSDSDNINAALEEARLLNIENIHTALLVVYVECANNLQKVKVYKQPDPYMVLTVGKNQQKSRVKRHTTNPRWEQGFYLLVKNPETDSLIISIVDKHTDTNMDRMVYNIKDLLREPSMQISKNELDLQFSPGGKITASLQLRVLQNALFESDSSDSDPDDDTGSSPSLRPQRTPSKKDVCANDLVKEVTIQSKTSQVSEAPVRSSAFHLKPQQYGRIELSLFYSQLRQKLAVTVHRIANLPLKDPDHIPDAYVKLKLSNTTSSSSKAKTKVIVDCCDPVFEENFEFLLSESDLPTHKLIVSAKNKKFFNSSTLGQTIINLKVLENVNEPVREWFDLLEEEESD